MIIRIRKLEFECTWFLHFDFYKTFLEIFFIGCPDLNGLYFTYVLTSLTNIFSTENDDFSSFIYFLHIENVTF